MRNVCITEQALPLPGGRILRFARCHVYALSVTMDYARIHASYRSNLTASPSASLVASHAANSVAFLMLRHI